MRAGRHVARRLGEQIHVILLVRGGAPALQDHLAVHLEGDRAVGVGLDRPMLAPGILARRIERQDLVAEGQVVEAFIKVRVDQSLAFLLRLEPERRERILQSMRELDVDRHGIGCDHAFATAGF